MKIGYFIGIDPGPTPGVVGIGVEQGRIVLRHAYQCNADGLSQLVISMARPDYARIQAERFVVGRRSGRSSSASAGEATRDQLGLIQGMVIGRLTLRSASDVKPWATDERLAAAGLLDATAGMRHARDAARHALFLAVNSGALQDPLIRKA